MANNPHSTLTFLLITLSLAVHALGARDIHPNPNKKQPELFLGTDGSILIPGIGRWMLPKNKKGFNPFTYNPVTGTSGGPGFGIPSYGGIGGTGSGSYVPGGDDTFVPNPGVEVPIPGSGGSVPSPARH